MIYHIQAAWIAILFLSEYSEGPHFSEWEWRAGYVNLHTLCIYYVTQMYVIPIFLRTTSCLSLAEEVREPVACDWKSLYSLVGSLGLLQSQAWDPGSWQIGDPKRWKNDGKRWLDIRTRWYISQTHYIYIWHLSSNVCTWILLAQVNGWLDRRCLGLGDCGQRGFQICLVPFPLLFVLSSLGPPWFCGWCGFLLDFGWIWCPALDFPCRNLQSLGSTGFQSSCSIKAGSLPWMSCPFSALELRDLISKLEVLERWQRREEGQGAQASDRGREVIPRHAPLLPGCQSTRPNFLQFLRLLAFGSWRRTLDLLL